MLPTMLRVIQSGNMYKKIKRSGIVKTLRLKFSQKSFLNQTFLDLIGCEKVNKKFRS